MKYTCSLTIDHPREAVLTLYKNMDNYPLWQKGFVGMKSIDGIPGEAGSKTELIYSMNGRDVTMVETVRKASYPDLQETLYEAKGVWNLCINTFEADGNTTRWSMETDFQFSGFMSIMSIFMKGQFRKQTQSDMEAFKHFVESELGTSQS